MSEGRYSLMRTVIKIMGNIKSVHLSKARSLSKVLYDEAELFWTLKTPSSCTKLAPSTTTSRFVLREDFTVLRKPSVRSKGNYICSKMVHPRDSGGHIFLNSWKQQHLVILASFAACQVVKLQG